MTLRLNGSSSGHTEIKAPAAAGDNTITLPTSNGSAEQFLKNSGTAGELEFSSMVETSDGDIGIGDSSPSGGKLIVRSTLDSSNKQLVLEDATNGWQRKIGVDSSNNMAFYDGNTERMRLDSSGRLLVGTNTARTNWNDSSVEPKIIIEGAEDDDQFSLCIVSNSGTSNSSTRGANLILARTRGTSNGSNTALTSNNLIGKVEFKGNDGTAFTTAATISALTDATPGTDDMPGRLVFNTTADGAATPSERMRISSTGRISMAHDGSYYNGGATLSVSASVNDHVNIGRNTNASFSNHMLGYYSSRSANSAFRFIDFRSTAGSDVEFNLRGDGNAYADGSWNGGGADYAEYFEWSDGNTEAEDRRGISVVLDGDKIREAVDGEEPIGVISSNPSVVGDADIDRWKGMYLRDDFGTYLLDTHNVVEWNETITDSEGNQSTKKHSYEDWNIPDGIVVPDDAVVSATDENGQPYTHRRLNPDYNPDTAYISRENRAEWDTVGLMGKLRIRKGQVTGARWIKMRDVSDTVEEWLVR